MPLLAESRSTLWSEGNSQERRLQAGKVQNLRMALRTIHGVNLPAGEIFSFWRQVGRPTARRGFATGRELREGCLIPSVGGGLCQLSNALHDCALQAGLKVVERHAHSRVISGSLAEQDRDATVFWNYVDLRFASKHRLRIETRLDAQHLTVRFLGMAGPTRAAEIRAVAAKTETAPASCTSCGMASCFRNLQGSQAPEIQSAVLADTWWPELDRYLQVQPRSGCLLFVPLDGQRWKIPRYRWTTTGYAGVRQDPFLVAKRSLISRGQASHGAARQRALLAHDEELARRHARRLSPEATHLTIAQNLLPFLWRDGVLGGRTYDVLLTRWPLWILQQHLDRAVALHPESLTLKDFRASPSLVEAERKALQHAHRIITPHSGIASLFGDKGHVIPWQLPARTTAAIPRGAEIVFPAATLGRNGAYELREAARSLSLPITLAGAVLESKDFWQGVEVRERKSAWLDHAAVVVLPAFLLHRPHRLLEALGRGLPVITTKECGLGDLPSVTTVPAGNASALAAALNNLVITKQ